MPVVINELHVKINVEEEPDRDQPTEVVDAADDKDAVIDACVEKVLDVLEQKKRR